MAQEQYLFEVGCFILAQSSTTRTITDTGSVSFVLTEDIRFIDVEGLSAGMTVVCDAGSGNTITGTVVSYDTDTLTLVITATAKTGSGSQSSWTISGSTTLRVSSHGFNTEPDEPDAPVSAHYPQLLSEAIEIARDAFSEGKIAGESVVSVSDIKLINDRRLDPWRRYGFSGQSFTLRLGPLAGYIADFATVVIGRVDQPDFTMSLATFKAMDRMADFDAPLMPSTFLGINSGSTGIEGTPDTTKGAVRPRAWGKNYNGQPVLLNASALIYGVNFVGALSRSAVACGTGSKTFVLDRDTPFVGGVYFVARYDDSNYMIGTVTSYTAATKTVVANIGTAVGSATQQDWECAGTAPVASIDAVRDGGSAVTFSTTDRATLAALQAASISSGQYDTCLAEGLVRLGSSPSRQVTCDFTQGANSAARTVAQIMKTIALDPGKVATTEVTSADVTALDTANSAVVGLYARESMSVREAEDALANTAGAWIGFSALSMLRMKRIEAPTGSPVVTFRRFKQGVAAAATDIDIIGIERIPDSGMAKKIPPYQMLMGYKRNWAPQRAGELATSVTDANRAFYENEWRWARSKVDANVRRMHPRSQPETITSLFTAESDCQTEVDRRHALVKVFREQFRVTGKISADLADAVDLIDEARIADEAFGMSAGKDFVVMRVQLNRRTGQIICNLWG